MEKERKATTTTTGFPSRYCNIFELEFIFRRIATTRKFSAKTGKILTEYLSVKEKQEAG